MRTADGHTGARHRSRTVDTNWNTATAAMRWPNHGEATTWLYIGPNGRRFDLEGRFRGRQGVRMHPSWPAPTTCRSSISSPRPPTRSAPPTSAPTSTSGPSRWESSWAARVYNAHAYRMIEDNWWEAWPHDRPGWLGCHTRFGGWRWAQVMLADARRGQGEAGSHRARQQRPVVGHEDRRPETVVRQADPVHHLDRASRHSGGARRRSGDRSRSPTAASLPVWPLFLIKGPGRAWVQDGMTDRMVQLPVASGRTATCLCDTDPANRTLTGSSDPVDNIFFELVRSSTDSGFPAARHQRARAAGVAARQRDPVHQPDPAPHRRQHHRATRQS